MKMQTHKFTIQHLKPYRWRLAFYAVLAAAAIVFTMATALSVSDFLRLLFDGEETTATAPAGNLVAAGLNWLYDFLIGYGQMAAIVIFSVIVVVLYLLKNVFTYGSLVSIDILRAKVVRDIRGELFAKCMRLPMEYYGRVRRGDLLARFSADISEYEENIIESIKLFFSSLLGVVIYLVMLFYINYKLTLFVLCMIPVIVFAIAGVKRRLRRDSVELQEKGGGLLAMIEETIVGLKVIKAYTAIGFSNDRFKAYDDDYTRLRTRIYRRIDLASPLTEFLSNVVVIGILLFGAFLVFKGDGGLTPELFISYIMMFVLMIEPAKNLSTALTQFKKGQACEARLQELLDEADGEVAYFTAKKRFEGLQRGIEFSEVSFAYGGRAETQSQLVEVLHGVSLQIPKGEKVALVGSSGSGKSTMADILCGFNIPCAGEVLIDGQPMREYSLDSLRSHIGVVSQQTILFNDTIFANIAFSMPTATAEQVEQAAKAAHAHEFIMQLPEGYQTVIGDGGETLSGGQRQRLSIARAILMQPEILVFDEATSALDTQNERLVQQALDGLLAGRTALIIAHRLSTIKGADRIVVLEGGKVVETGNHEELMRKKGRYFELVTLQEIQK